MPSILSVGKLQEGIYSALTNNHDLGNLITGIYDYIPDNNPFPYITISQVSLVKNNTLGLSGKTLNIDVHIFSDYSGNSVVYSILDQLNVTLDHPDTLPSAEGWDIDYVRFENSDVIVEKEYRHLIAKYELGAHETIT